jgi:hypothetical protein
MKHLVIDTSSGPLGFVGRFLTDRRRPALLAVNGAFPPDELLHDLTTTFLDANVLIVDLPGMSGVFWAENPNVMGLTSALEDAARRLLGDVPMVALGVSTGNLLSLGLRLPSICHRVAVEPFFQPIHLWPFTADSVARLERNPDFWVLDRFLWNFFGIGRAAIENRDYQYLLKNITVPTDVMVGHAPLFPKRELDFLPSLTSRADRDNLLANPFVTLHEGPRGSGHSYGIAPDSYDDLKRLLRAALDDAHRRV